MNDKIYTPLFHQTCSANCHMPHKSKCTARGRGLTLPVCRKVECFYLMCRARLTLEEQNGDDLHLRSNDHKGKAKLWSGDLWYCHDSAHALLALALIEERFKELLSAFSDVLYISDGATNHFKYYFWLCESKKKTHVTKWIYKASGHEKSACEGVGGVLEYHTSIHNLKRTELSSKSDARTFVEKLSH